jgi:ATP-binding protein involved in chromosome partitioning
LAKEMDVPFLGRVPLDPAVAQSGDAGAPTVLSSPESMAATALDAVTTAVEVGISAPV